MGKGVLIGFILLFSGMLIIMFSILYQAFRQGTGGKYGGVVVIGPIPLVFGSDSDAVKIAIIGAIFLMAFALILMLLPLIIAKKLTPP